ncbi:hypothetical protein [Stutzerimonas stutzeri]|uniref:hypothetical protein n=1 Tax=Stutzerimonas stutzeri TaxID=316 RepID=UPI0015E2AEA1|nr:hypothetical protein [Stutzerimonas stutzeri]MBA1264985.1 hypothetical protein [Stutzerimonas stutzeri]
MDHTIDDFWKRRFSLNRKTQGFVARPGWSDISQPLEAFEVADLSLRAGYSDLEQPLWLIAAPGEKVGASFQDVNLKRYGAQTQAYLRASALQTVNS